MPTLEAKTALLHKRITILLDSLSSVSTHDQQTSNLVLEEIESIKSILDDVRIRYKSVAPTLFNGTAGTN